MSSEKLLRILFKFFHTFSNAMPYSRFSRRVPSYSRMYHGTTRRRSAPGRRLQRVRGLPLSRAPRNTDALTIRRPFSDVVFLADGSSNLAAANYTNPVNQIVYLSATSGDITTGVGTLSNQAGFSCQWTVRDVLGSTPFLALYNQYQIKRFTVVFTMMNGSFYNPTTANTLPMLIVAYDPNDSGVPPDFDRLATFQNYRQHQFGDNRPSFRYSFVPKAAIGNYVSSVTTGYGAVNSNRDMWFDTVGGANTLHYGLKGWFRNLNTSTTSGLGIRMQVYADVVFRQMQ
jgi:hypothetical protein